MMKINDLTGEYCYRALHTIHAVFHNDEGQLILRAMNSDNSALQEIEITSFERVAVGTICV